MALDCRLLLLSIGWPENDFSITRHRWTVSTLRHTWRSKSSASLRSMRDDERVVLTHAGDAEQDIELQFALAPITLGQGRSSLVQVSLYTAMLSIFVIKYILKMKTNEERKRVQVQHHRGGWWQTTILHQESSSLAEHYGHYSRTGDWSTKAMVRGDREWMHNNRPTFNPCPQGKHENIAWPSVWHQTTTKKSVSQAQKSNSHRKKWKNARLVHRAATPSIQVNKSING